MADKLTTKEKMRGSSFTLSELMEAARKSQVDLTPEDKKRIRELYKKREKYNKDGVWGSIANSNAKDRAEIEQARKNRIRPVGKVRKTK